jgi:hypothetical protein
MPRITAEKRVSSARSNDRKKLPLKDWTMMVYMAGDNNLSGDMASALESFRTTQSSDEGSSANVLVFFDSASLTAPTQFIDYSDGEPFKQNVAIENSASATTIEKFVRWCVETRKRRAKNYILIFSGHAFGFFGSTFLMDQSSGKHLSLRRFRSALEKVRHKHLHPNSDEKIAIVGFDACEMSMLEVGYELKDVAHTLVASEGNLPNAGWGYAPMLKQFLERDAAKTIQNLTSPASSQVVKHVATEFVARYIEQQRAFAIGGVSVDMSAWDLDKTGGLAESVGQLGNTLSEMLGLNSHIDRKGKISDQELVTFDRTRSLILQSRAASQTYMHEQAVDLKDLCQKLQFGCRQIIEECKLTKQPAGKFEKLEKVCATVIKNLDDCVLSSGFSGDEYQFSKGISIYFPWTALTYCFTWRVYGNLQFSCGGPDGERAEKKTSVPAGKGWDDFLLYYLYVVTMRTCEGPDFYRESYDALKQGGLRNGDWAQVVRNWNDVRVTAAVSGRSARSQTMAITRENWRTGTKENWPVTGTRENWPTTGTRENPRDTGTRENWPTTGTRENWPTTGTRENPWKTGTREGFAMDALDYMYFFGRIRNFMLDWEAGGLWRRDQDQASGAPPARKRKESIEARK